MSAPSAESRPNQIHVMSTCEYARSSLILLHNLCAFRWVMSDPSAVCRRNQAHKQKRKEPYDFLMFQLLLPLACSKPTGRVPSRLVCSSNDDACQQHATCVFVWGQSSCCSMLTPCAQVERSCFFLLRTVTATQEIRNRPT